MEAHISIFSNRMELSTEGSSATVYPTIPYVGRRILVGTFQPAVDCLREGMKQLGLSGILKRKPILRLEAMEMNEGGLSEVEERCLREVGLTAGARSVEVR